MVRARGAANRGLVEGGTKSPQVARSVGVRGRFVARDTLGAPQRGAGRNVRNGNPQVSRTARDRPILRCAPRPQVSLPCRKRRPAVGVVARSGDRATTEWYSAHQDKGGVVPQGPGDGVARWQSGPGSNQAL